MASEIRVDKINSLSGVGTVTLSPTGVDISGITTVQTLKVGTGLTASEDGDVFFTGVCTATTFTGSGANLTNLPAANVTGTLPAISGANLTSLTAGNLTGTVADARLSTVSSSKLSGALPALDGSALTGIGGTDFIHAEQVNVSGVTTSKAFVPTNQNLSHRNIIINGDMSVAQRGTSSAANGFGSLDRFSTNFDSGLTEAPTHAQVALSSSDTPYDSGLRYAFRLTNGNQTSQNANDYINVTQKIEAQDMASSGWNYTSSSSYITLSFWIKASIAQTMYVRLEDPDGSRIFAFAVAVTTSWQKITKTIPGNSNVAFNNDNGIGLSVRLIPYYGTSYTSSGTTVDSWIADSGTAQIPDMANTWFSGNDATLDYTGLQLEVGESATLYEHCSYGDSLRRCQRYCFVVKGDDEDSLFSGYATDNSTFYWIVNFPTPMRAYPTYTGSSSDGRFSANNTGADFNWSSNVFTFNNATTPNPSSMWFGVDSSGISGGQGGRIVPQNGACTLIYSAEL